MVIILSLISITGCKKSISETPVQPVAEQQKFNLEPAEDISKKYGEITDPVELEKLWQEYIYDSIPSVGNTNEYNSSAEINPLYIAEFCWLKYISEHGKESLALESKESSQRLFPLETVLEYAKRYFDLDRLDMYKIPEGYYDPARKAFIFGFGGDKNTTYNEVNAWGFILDKVTRNSDDTITVVLIRYDSQQKSRLELTETINLKERADGSLYFISGKREYVNNNLVKLIGAYQGFDKITGFDGRMEELTMIGQVEDKIILLNDSYMEGSTDSIMLVSLDKFSVEKKYKLGEDYLHYGVNVKEGKVVVKLKDKVKLLDSNLEELEEIPLPQIIAEKILREPKFNENGFLDTYFGGYDISQDLTQIAYSDEVGLKLFKLMENSEKLLSETVKLPDNKLIEYSYHHFPRFIGLESKLITTMTGYEGAMGYNLYNFANGDSKKIGIGAEGSSTSNIFYDTGLLEVNIYIYNKDTQETVLKSAYLDFKTGEITEISLKDPGDTGDIRSQDYCYIGQEYAAYVTYKSDYNDRANSIHYINRLKLNTLSEEPQIISVKAADTHILGVLADGRVVFWYDFYPSESGVGITK